MNRLSRDISTAVRRHAHRRYRLQAAGLGLCAAGIGAVAGAVLGALLLLDVLPRGPVWVPVAFLLLPAAVVLSASIPILRPVDRLAEAKRIDDLLGLKDRLSSALVFAVLPERTLFHEAAIADARGRLVDVEAHRRTGASLRRPVLGFLAAVLVSAATLGTAVGLRPAGEVSDAADALASDQVEQHADQRAQTEHPSNHDTEGETTDEGLVEVEDTTLTDEAPVSAFDEADLKTMEALAASETSEADRLLAQAAYLDESELDDSAVDRSGSGSNEDVVMMKEPDMDLIREMVKQAQERKKKGEDQSGDSDDINLEVLVKSHAASSGKRSRKRGPSKRSASGGGGPSQDTRIKPKRVKVEKKVEFKITSVRSLTPSTASGAKRIVLSEAIMRTSGVPQPPLVKARGVGDPDVPEASRPVCAQGVPSELRAYISRYFEGLKELSQSP